MAMGRLDFKFDSRIRGAPQEVTRGKWDAMAHILPTRLPTRHT